MFVCFLILFFLFLFCSLNQLSPEWKSSLFKLSRRWGRLGIYWEFWVTRGIGQSSPSGPLLWPSRDPGDGRNPVHVQMASCRCLSYFHGGGGGRYEVAQRSRQLNGLCLIDGGVGGLSSLGGEAGCASSLRFGHCCRRHVRPY